MSVKLKIFVSLLFFACITLAVCRGMLTSCSYCLSGSVIECERPKSSILSDDDQAKVLRMQLIWIPSEEPERPMFKLRLKNAGSQPIVIDSRCLNPVRMISIEDDTGKKIGTYPCPPPRAVKKSDLITLFPEQFHDCRPFHVNNITCSLKSGTPPYSIQCRYQTDQEGYDEKYRKKWNVWRGTIHSNIVYFEMKPDKLLHSSPPKIDAVK